VIALYDLHAGHGAVRVALRSLRLGPGRHVIGMAVNPAGRSLLRRAGGRLRVRLIDSVAGGAASATAAVLVS